MCRRGRHKIGYTLIEISTSWILYLYITNKINSIKEIGNVWNVNWHWRVSWVMKVIQHCQYFEAWGRGRVHLILSIQRSLTEDDDIVFNHMPEWKTSKIFANEVNYRSVLRKITTFSRLFLRRVFLSRKYVEQWRGSDDTNKSRVTITRNELYTDRLLKSGLSCLGIEPTKYEKNLYFYDVDWSLFFNGGKCLCGT